MTAWSEERKAAKREYNRAYYAANRSKVLGQVRAYREANLERLQLAEIERKYGLARGQYQRLFESQGGVCAICRRAETFDRKGYRRARLSVDHDHATGLVRGLLCMDCNRAIGLFRDDIDVLEGAIAYLQDHAIRQRESAA